MKQFSVRGRRDGVLPTRAREARGGGPRLGQVSFVGAALGIFLALVGWGCIAGTVLHVGHLRNAPLAIPLALASLLLSFRLLLPAFMACLGAPGYSIPVELQDLL
eukprot:CAMPEP_0185832150 /NCGR_PEP_ID=MMETSP1353-20130828/1918_1 /TAXON_ID=1077150 /ORGANISM="Erythrolobus australicus, Strain CCMP3124" /LENGTH=104 /DNA_ID=CAMNT_0028530297 /DNA_START=147 /DNA_END=461 /DNA_ORIENTATION=+